MGPWLALLLAVPSLFGVVPDLPGPGPGDEAIGIACPSSCDVSGWRLEDDEGAWILPAGTWANGTLWIAGDPALWARFDAGPAIRGEGDLRMANSGDELRLVSPTGERIDEFAWGPGGDVVVRSPGLVYRQQEGDWVTPRLHRVGESELPGPTFIADEVTLYASPEHTFQVLVDLIRTSTYRLHLHVYDLRHPELVHELITAKAANPGLDLAVLVDGHPVGHGDDERAETAAGLSALKAVGAEVVVADGRYVHHHLKVLVADDRTSVQSENWVHNGVPPDGSGNRGWGVVVDDAEMADWMADWMRQDRKAWDAAVWTNTGPPPTRWATLPAPPPAAAPVTVHDVQVRPVIGPDHTAYPAGDPIALLLAAAEERILGQQLTLRERETADTGWDRPDRLWQGLTDAGARGVDVRVLAEHAPAARFVAPFEGRLHNKAWVVDDALVVGSMNGNHHSRAQNREVSIIIESAELADAAAAWWEADSRRPLPMTALPILFAVLWVVAFRSRC